MYTSDFDHTFGLWFKDIPYWWCPGKKPDTGRRFYVVHPNAAAVFDEQQCIADPTWVQHEMFCHRIAPEETFSFFPTTNIHRDMSLMYIFPATHNSGLNKPVVFPYDKQELRVNGLKVSEKILDGNGFGVFFKNQIVTVITPTGPFIQITYPWRFGNYFATTNGIHCELYYKSQHNRVYKFGDLYEVRDKWNLDNKAVTDIHNLAVAGQKGWRYIWHDKERGGSIWATCQILFENLIGERPIFPLRDTHSQCMQVAPVKKLSLEELHNEMHNKMANMKISRDNMTFSLDALEKRIQKTISTLSPTFKVPVQDPHKIEPEIEIVFGDDGISDGFVSPPKKVSFQDCTVETFGEPLANSDDED